MAPNPYSPPPATPERADVHATQSSGVRGCAASFFLALGGFGAAVGSVWIYTFGFTDYRAPLGKFGLPLGTGIFVFSVAMIWFGVKLNFPRAKLNR